MHETANACPVHETVKPCIIDYSKFMIYEWNNKKYNLMHK